MRSQLCKSKKGRWVMFRKVLALVAVVLAFGVCDLQAAQINSTWVGGSQGEWGQASNWDPAIVPDNNPTNTFAVTIDAGGDEVFVALQQWRTIDQLDCYGEVELQNWTSGWIKLTLVDANGLTNHGYLEIENIEINGNVTNLAGATLDSWNMDIGANLYNQAGATIEVEGESDVEGDLQNDGTITIIHASDLWCHQQVINNGLINIYCGEFGVKGIVDNNSTGVIRGFGVIYAEQLLRNKGGIYAYGGSLAVLSEGSLLNTGVLGNTPLSSLHIKPGEDVNNQGTIEANAGGGVAFDCNLVNEPNGVIKLLGGTLAATTITQTADANFAGFGTITGDVVIEPNGLIQLTGPTNIVGDMQIGTGATLEISDGTTLITGYTTNNGTIHMKGGRIIPQGGFTNNGNIMWEPGTFNNIADFNLDGLVNFKDFADFADTWLWKAQL